MKLGIALAGGGIRGSAHLGILTALEEHGIVADMYAGTSAGAIVASFKALGATNEQCLEILDEMSENIVDIAWLDILKSMWGKFRTLDGLLKGETLRNFLYDKTYGAVMNSVKKPLAIVSCDLRTGSQVVFTSEPMIDYTRIASDAIIMEKYEDLYLFEMMYASSAIPAIFQPLVHENMTLVDGSVTNNLPANTLREMGATHIIAIDLVNRHENREVQGIGEIVDRTISIMIEQNMEYSVKGIESCIQMNPHIKGVGFLDFKKLKQTYHEGYAYGQYIAPTIKLLLED
jgi:NTE family protein